MDFKVKVGDKEVVYSGVVSSTSNETVYLELDPNIRIKLLFSNNDKPNQSMETKIDDEGVLNFDLINFNNPLGVELTEPIAIGTYNGRQLFFHVKVLGNQNKRNRTIIHTWLLGGAITNG